MNYNKNDLFIGNFDKLCRTCLSKNNINSIFTTIKNTDAEVKNVLEHFEIDVEHTENMPETICETCLNIITQYTEFKRQVQKVNVLLKELLTTEDNVIKQEFELQEDASSLENFSFEKSKSVFTCNVCKTIFSTDSELQAHIEQELHNNQYDCPQCTKSFPHRSKLYIHQQEFKHYKTKIRQSIKCEYCDKDVVKKTYKNHLRVHTQEKPFACEICDRSFSLKRNLKRHIMTHTGEKPFVCNICNKGFIQAVSLKEHIKKHGPKLETAEKKWICDECGRTFQRHVHYMRHLRSHAGDEKPAAEVRSPELICNECGRGYASLASLRVHHLSHGTKGYLCDDCGKGFATKTMLKSHLRTHTKERPYKCVTCDKAFSHSHTLASHIAIHKNQKPYGCKVCDKSFRQASHLKQHLRLHNGEKPYDCPYCGKCFTVKGNLVVHIRLHTGETPYKCTVCDKGFHDSSSLKKHVKRHEDKNDFSFSDVKTGDVTDGSIL